MISSEESESFVFYWFPERSGPCDVAQYDVTFPNSIQGIAIVHKISQKLKKKFFTSCLAVNVSLTFL